MSNKRKARARGRVHAARHWAPDRVDTRTPAEKAAQVVGFGPTELRTLQDAHAVLSAVKDRLPPTYRGLARRLKRHPDIFGEFRAAHALDASTETLIAILAPLRQRKQSVPRHKGA
jgi:hypothetical protein